MFLRNLSLYLLYYFQSVRGFFVSHQPSLRMHSRHIVQSLGRAATAVGVPLMSSMSKTCQKYEGRGRKTRIKRRLCHEVYQFRISIERSREFLPYKDVMCTRYLGISLACNGHISFSCSASSPVTASGKTISGSSRYEAVATGLYLV